MKLLVLGGTAFVGRHIVEAARARGHSVTIFHRGKTNPHVFPDVEKVIGERDGDLAALSGRTWDAVVDTSAYLPRVVDRSARALADRAGHYTFVSTGSVYKDFTAVGMTESAPRAVIAEPLPEVISNETYGAMKARCERAAANHFPGKLLIVRPGIVVGPYDYTGRFAYWPRRILEGGTVLAPGEASRRLQAVDARDLAAWTLARIEVADAGIYNVVGPVAPWTWGAFLEECQRVTKTVAELVWAPDSLLQSEGLTGADLPLWVPAAPASAGFYAVSSAKAQAAGLLLRPLGDSIADALASSQGITGMARSREAEVLRRLTGV
jgi:2'-hydroxyisoflavone reductase